MSGMARLCYLMFTGSSDLVGIRQQGRILAYKLLLKALLLLIVTNLERRWRQCAKAPSSNPGSRA